ncbi:MAG: MarR family winged helix-turn-helix transcriptional regulator [Acidimicrobiia bacterium]|nr:MarR family winged helix-turn-helix transcriptional regulator [Acidimicrobiia bacterium]
MGRIEPNVFSAHLILLVEDHKRRHEQHIAASAVGEMRYRHHKVFLYLDREHGSRLVDLAAANGIRIQSMAELVDEMEAAGLVERTADPHDGRAKRIRYTRKGLEVLDASTAASIAVWNEYAEVLGRDEMEHLQRQLERLTQYAVPRSSRSETA